jgi:hypothetical protein
MRLTRRDAEFLAAGMAGRGVAIELRPQLAPVSDAIVLRRSPHEVERIARRVVVSAWQNGLHAVAVSALDDAERKAQRILELVDRARAEMMRPPAENRFAELLVLCASLRTAHEAHQLRDALESIEAELREERPERRATIALRNVGRIVAWRGDIPSGEVIAAAARVRAALGEAPDLDLAEPFARALAQAVATDARRLCVHQAARDLLRAAVGYPLLAELLGRIVEQEPERDAGDDELWVVTVIGAFELC